LVLAALVLHLALIQPLTPLHLLVVVMEEHMLLLMERLVVLVAVAHTTLLLLELEVLETPQAQVHPKEIMVAMEIVV
jgi:hypothetical protein